MPFCTNCGTNVDPEASYCFHCGQRQQPHASHADFLNGISDRTASILCYIPVLGVIPAIVFLVAQQFRHNVKVRFNAFQSLYLFVAWLIVSSAFPIILVGSAGWGVEHSFVYVLKVGVFLCWVYLLVKAANYEQVRLPIVGDLAARSTLEQM